jgi:hypothetical protein
MATFELTGPDGAKYRVEAPNEDQAMAAFSSFAGSKSAAAPPPDKYQQAAIDERKALFPGQDAGGSYSNAVTSDAGFTRRLVHGATLGADSTILAAMETPLEMLKRRTWSPSEGYNYAKAREDQIMGDARKNTGALGTAAEILGGAVSGEGLANGGATAARFVSPVSRILLANGQAGIGLRSLLSAGDSAGLGALSGAMEGNGLNERAASVVKGGAFGGALGLATPAAAAFTHAIAAPIFANVGARFDPAGYAGSQVARGIAESGRSPEEIARSVQQAAAEGQPQFAVADAMGNPGQRLLSTVARSPGEGRTMAVGTLEARQAGQGRRVANTLAEGFDSPRTAEQTRRAMERARDENADAEYGAVRADATPVDVSGVIRNIEAIDQGRAAAMRGRTEDTIPAFQALAPEGQQAFRAGYVDPLIEAAQSAPIGANKAHPLTSDAFRDEATAISPRGPLSTFPINENSRERFMRQGFPHIVRVDAAALRDAAERNIGEPLIWSEGKANALRNSGGAEGYPRVGVYRDRVGIDDGRHRIAVAAERGQGIDVAVSSPEEAAALQRMAAGNPERASRMFRKIDREMTMFETRNTALGGSKTIDNANDDAAMSVDSHLIGQIISGNWHGAVDRVIASGANAMTGNTPEVRRDVARILLQNGARITPTQLRQMVDNTVARLRFVQNIARVGTAAWKGVAVALPEATAQR